MLSDSPRGYPIVKRRLSQAFAHDENDFRVMITAYTHMTPGSLCRGKGSPTLPIGYDSSFCLYHYMFISKNLFIWNDSQMFHFFAVERFPLCCAGEDLPVTSFL